VAEAEGDAETEDEGVAKDISLNKPFHNEDSCDG
jgi:hypothetical protein